MWGFGRKMWTLKEDFLWLEWWHLEGRGKRIGSYRPSWVAKWDPISNKTKTKSTPSFRDLQWNTSKRIILEEDFNMLGQSVASSGKVPSHLVWRPWVCSLAPCTEIKLSKWLEGKGTERRAGIWPQVDAINTILLFCGLGNIPQQGLCPSASGLHQRPTQPWLWHNYKRWHCIKGRKEKGKRRTGPELSLRFTLPLPYTLTQLF